MRFKKIKRETAGKHIQNTKNQKRNKEIQRETQGNRFHYKCGLWCLPERDPKLKHTEMGFSVLLTFERLKLHLKFTWLVHCWEYVLIFVTSIYFYTM